MSIDKNNERVQRIERIADALRAYDVREMNATEAATVLVDTFSDKHLQTHHVNQPVNTTPSELPKGTLALHSERWIRIIRVLDEVTPGWIRPARVSVDTGADAELAIRKMHEKVNTATARAQNAEATVERLEREVKAARDYVRAACERLSIRKDSHANDGEMLLVAIDAMISDHTTLAQTAKDATARAEKAENERAELKMRNNNLHEENINVHKLATDLRAQLDAMTGEQVPVIDVFCKNNVCMFGSSTFPSTLPDGVHTPYRHPSPAARVVGVYVVKDGKVVDTWFSTRIDSGEAGARHMANMMGGVACMVTELPALTPNADGQTARVDEVSDTANGLRHVARGPNSPQEAVAYGRTAKDATQLLDTIRQHKSTPNADGAK